MYDLLEFGENKQNGGIEEKKTSIAGKRDGEEAKEGQIQKAEE